RADVPADVTVVGRPAKSVRVPGQKDETVSQDMEDGREHYTTTLAELREASHRSSHV
ncbi:serine O-acetyltransferase, partial [Streptococcus suis]